jgi:mannitol-1-phosphate 5-dehydrogenase
MSGKIVVFGAGATGRTTVGLTVWQAGYELVLVDKKPDLVKLLQQSGRYTVRLYGGPSGPDEYQDVTVTGYRAYYYQERQAIAQEIVTADLVFTAVIDYNLADVAQTVALAAAACREAGRDRPLNFIACENMMDSSTSLRRHMEALLSPADRAYTERYFGFPDCMISQVVPIPEPDPLWIVTENYIEWTARAEAFKGPKPPNLEALELVSDRNPVNNQTARLERKLFIHNGGHAVCGYYGFHYGWRYIHEAVADPRVLRQVVGALDELGEVVRRKHGFSVESINAYQADLGRRGSIAALKDDLLRVVRDPIRKLSNRERLVAPAMLAVEYGLPRGWIVQGMVAALKYKHPGDAQSLVLAQKLAEKGLHPVLKEVCSIPSDSPLIPEIQAAWEQWRVL